jgi:hypothetical protein
LTSSSGVQPDGSLLLRSSASGMAWILSVTRDRKKSR